MRLFKNRQTLDVLSPATGEMQELADVPDQVFAEGILGPGFAVIPDDDTVVAPLSGVVKGLLPSRHALYIETADGVQLLVHVGIDTVKLGGQHYTALVSAEDQVVAGQPIIQWDRRAVAEAGFGTQVLVCLVELGPYRSIRLAGVGKAIARGVTAAVILP